MASFDLTKISQAWKAPSTPLKFATSGLAICGAWYFVRAGIAWSKLTSTEPAIQSPRKTLLPGMHREEIEGLPLPPDCLHGGRYIASPYGDLRVYEWGPEDGRKVLVLTGVSYPCVTLGKMAKGLVQRGCRVMMIEYWGRGYSDAPTDLPYDDRLYTTQILLAIASSPLSWTGGSTKFALIGYSMGGGVAANFASYFPAMVSSLVLLAPGAFIDPDTLPWWGKWIRRGLLSPAGMRWYMLRTLKSAQASNAKLVEKKQREGADNTKDLDLAKAMDMADVFEGLVWMWQNHLGTPKACHDSFLHSPATGQHSRWRVLGEMLTAAEQRKPKPGSSNPHLVLDRGKIFIMLADSDDMIDYKSMRESSVETLGEENVAIHTIEDDHDFPTTRSEDVIEAISTFWGLEHI